MHDLRVSCNLCVKTAAESEQSMEISRLYGLKGPNPGVVAQTETYPQDVNRLGSLDDLFKDPTKSHRIDSIQPFLCCCC